MAIAHATRGHGARGQQDSSTPPRSNRNASILLWLLGFTVLYQLGYQVVIHNKLQSEVAGDPCPFGGPQCMETRLFQSWQEKIQGDKEDQLALAPAGEDLEHLAQEELDEATSERGQTALASWESLPSQLQQVVKEELEDDEEDSLLNGFVSLQLPLVTPQGGQDSQALAEEASTTASAAAPEASATAAEERQQLHALGKTDPSVSPAGSTSASAAQPTVAVAGGESLRGRAVVAASPPPRHHPLTVANSTGSNTTGLTAWAIDLIALQERLEARMNGLISVQKRLASEDAPSKEELSLADRIRSLGTEMCMEPHRRGRPACVQFLEDHRGIESRRAEAGSAVNSSSSSAVHNSTILSRRQLRAERRAEAAKKASLLDQRLKELAAGRKAWELLVSNRIVAFGKEMCADLRRSGYPSCAPFLGVGNSATPRNATPSKQHAAITTPSPPVHWRDVVLWVNDSQSKRHNSSLAVVTREQLRRVRWGGMIPKVSCITAIPSGRDARARMKYFINNFRLQSYEGPRQLILVHHKNDTEASRLIRPYADGSYIKVVAAQGDGAFPSTTALRFGAWASDGDVVARWDFDEWHHPQRLSMQVRALALTGRPASLLRQWTVLEDGGREARTLSGHLGWEGSLVGEAAWMRQHWHPLLAEERAVLGGAQAHHVTQVDMPELSVYNAGSQDWASILKHFGPAVEEVVVTVAANQTAAK